MLYNFEKFEKLCKKDKKFQELEFKSEQLYKIHQIINKERDKYARILSKKIKKYRKMARVR